LALVSSEQPEALFVQATAEIDARVQTLGRELLA
jgi:hypothetical protein